MTSLKQHFETLAAYNAWANQRLYEAVETLSVSDYRKDCGAFFKSIEGTLNHLLVTDRIWRRRLTGESAENHPLNAILFGVFAELRAARIEEDRLIIRYVHDLTEHDLDQVISYRRVSTPDGQQQQVSAALAHWFNHQTHHRAQVQTLLTQTADRTPELDLLIYQRLQESKALSASAGSSAVDVATGLY